MSRLLILREVCLGEDVCKSSKGLYVKGIMTLRMILPSAHNETIRQEVGASPSFNLMESDELGHLLTTCMQPPSGEN